MFKLMFPLGLLSITAYLKGRGIDVDSVKITEGRGERLKDYHVVNVALYPGFLSVTFNIMQRSFFTSCYGYIYFESTRVSVQVLTTENIAVFLIVLLS